MKTIRVTQFGEPEVLKIADVPDLSPGPDQILVQLHAVGINPVETYIRSGKYAKLPELPYTPGTDGAGVIEKVGSEVLGWKAGQRVYVAGSVTGTYAAQTLCTASQIHRLPDGISFLQGAALGVPYATAHCALFHRGQAQMNETVLIHGATGGVGLAAVQLARAAGLTVFATGGTEEGRELARREGAEQVFDHHASDYPAKILELTHGQGVDLIIELLANVNLGKDLTLLATGGRVVVIGSRGPVEINPRDIMARNADIRGVMVGGTPPAVLAEIHSALIAGLEKGDLKPIVGREFPLADAAQAHVAVMSSGASGKIVLTV